MPETIEFAEVKGVEVFGAGTWYGSGGKIVVTGEMLDQMVRAFHELSDKVTGFRPPLKLGHTDAQRFLGQNNGAPALGWVSALRRVGDKIVADFSDVPASLIDLIRKRLYNSVSIELLPKLTYNGSTFENVLSAVAVLGAELPAVKGLKELSLSLFDAAVTDRIVLSEQEQGHTMADATFTQAQVDMLIDAAVTKAKNEIQTQFAAQIDKLTTEHKAALDAANAKVAEGEKKLKEFADKAATEQAARFSQNVKDAVDAAIKAGKVLPKDKAALVAFGETLDQTKKIKFSEKVEQTPFENWRDALAAGAAKVKFGEQSQAVHSEGGDKSADVEVNERATAKVTAAGGSDKLAFAVAVQQVLAEDPALKHRYITLG